MIHSAASQPLSADSAARRHEAAIQRTLTWAQAAADAGEYDEALAWLQTVDYVHGGLPAGWAERRMRWSRLVSEQERACD